MPPSKRTDGPHDYVEIDTNPDLRQQIVLLWIIIVIIIIGNNWKQSEVI